MVQDPVEPIERWTAKRRAALVLSVLERGDIGGRSGPDTWAHGGRDRRLERFLLGAENALRSLPKDDEALKDEQIKKPKQKIGDLVLDNDILREALKPYPLDRKMSDV